MDESREEHHTNSASEYMSQDYLNEYLSFLFLIEQANPEIACPRSFSDRYPDMKFGNIKFTVSDEEREKIQTLDSLAAQAKELLTRLPLNKVALLEIAIKVAETCGRNDIANQFRPANKE